MKDYQIVASDWRSMAGLLAAYLQGIKGILDSFWEEKLIQGRVYGILYEGRMIGFFSIYQENTLTSFYLQPDAFPLEQDAFRAATRQEFVKQALVATGDEYFLSLCMDLAKGVERQAFFFQRKHDEEMANEIELTLASQKDLKVIVQNSEDFFEDPAGQIRRKEIFLAKRLDELVGFGVYERGKLRKEFVSIGMYVIPVHRKQGMGTKILRRLQEIAIGDGLEPIAGCWVWNHASKKTLECAGMGAVARYLKVSF